MVVISELPGDGSNGGDPSKNPKELHKNHQEDDENQNKNPHEDDDEDQQEDDDEDPHEDDENQNENQNENQDEEIPQEVVNLPRNLPLPQELIENIVLRVGRCDYPALNLTSFAFRQLIASERLYNERLNLGLTESTLYVLMGFNAPDRDLPRWYILYRNIPRNMPIRLRQYSSIRSMFPGCAVVTIGPCMYVIGGCRGFGRATESVFLIDCRSHTCVRLPDMHRARCRPAAGVIDGNIYVIGGCKIRFDGWVEVFNVQTRIWTTISAFPPLDINTRGEFVTSVVMQQRIYILDPQCCFSYEPTRRHEWQTEHILWNHWRWSSCCVIDHLLYTIDPYCILGHLIVVYDPNDRHWRPVMGEYSLPANFVYHESQLVNFNGNLMIVGHTRSSLYQSMYQVWCIEIALEEREGNEIWGEVVSRALVLTSENKPNIELCRSVRV